MAVERFRRRNYSRRLVRLPSVASGFLHPIRNDGASRRGIINTAVFVLSLALPSVVEANFGGVIFAVSGFEFGVGELVVLGAVLFDFDAAHEGGDLAAGAPVQAAGDAV